MNLPIKKNIAPLTHLTPGPSPKERGGDEVAIYGAGGLGREIAWLIHDINQRHPQWNLIGFFDDGKEKGSRVDELPVLGGLAELNAVAKPLHVALAIADPETKRKIAGMITNPGLEFPVLIHPACITGNMNFNQFGKGTILTAGVILTTHVQLGDFVLINLATTVGHDVRIGSFCTIMPGCNISGMVTIGEGSMMGTGACTLQNITIGAGSVIGAGAVVTKSFEGKVKLIGIPAVNTP